MCWISLITLSPLYCVGTAFQQSGAGGYGTYTMTTRYFGLW